MLQSIRASNTSTSTDGIAMTTPSSRIESIIMETDPRRTRIVSKVLVSEILSIATATLARRDLERPKAA